MISDLLSNRKILFYTAYFSRKFFSCCKADLLVSKGHLANDPFSYVVLAQPQFWAFRAFALCVSLGNVHWGVLTSKGAGLVGVDCCWCSRFCSGRSHGLVHWEVGNGVFALIVWADIIWPISRVHVPRLCRGIRMASWGSLLSLLLSLDLLCLDQGMDPVIEFVWVD